MPRAVDIGDGVGDSPQARRSVGACLGRTDDLQDDCAEPIEDLPDGSSAEFGIAFPARLYPCGAQGRNGAFQVGRHHHDVVDVDDAIGVRTGQRRFGARRCARDAVDIRAVEVS